MEEEVRWELRTAPPSPHSAITPDTSDYRWKYSKEKGKAISNPALEQLPSSFRLNLLGYLLSSLRQSV